MSMNRRDAIKFGAATLAASTLLKAPNVWAQPAPIRIGVILPLSGTQAIAGQAWLAGTEIAIEQANRNGGVMGRTLELVVRDDKATGVGAVAAARELSDLGINLMIGANQGPVALAISPLMPEFNAVLVSGATPMSLTHENFNRNYFRLGANAHTFYSGLGRVLGEQRPEVGKWASIAFDSEAGRDAIAAFQYGLKQTSKAELSFADPLFTSPAAADYKTEISTLMNSDVEGLYLGLLAGNAVSFLQQARGVGLLQKLKVIGEAGNDSIIGRAMKQNTPDNIWTRGYWYPFHPLFKSNPISEQLYTDYVAKTGDKYPLSLVQWSHRMGRGLLAGLEKANDPGTDAVIAAMEGLEYDTAEGRQRIRPEDHQVIGIGHYANLKPEDAEPFYGTAKVVQLEDSVAVEAPAPGVAFQRS